MPNRTLRDWTASEKIDLLSVEAERFFTRLIMKVDDYGCLYASPKLLRAALFPLKVEFISENEIKIWLKECASTECNLIEIYNEDGKDYLHIMEFGQVGMRAKYRKYPIPPAHTEEAYSPANNRKKLKPFDPNEVENKINEFKEKTIDSDIWQQQTCKSYFTDLDKLIGFCNDWIAKAISVKKFESYQVNALIGFMMKDFEAKKGKKLASKKKDYSDDYKKP